VLDKSLLLVFLESNSQFLLGVHDDGPIPGHGLSDGFAGHQEEADGGFFARKEFSRGEDMGIEF
jgi:hypothetical protein